MPFYWLLLGILTVWRLTHMLNAESGPWNMLSSMRERAANGFWGDVLGCFYCLSVWIAAPVALFLGATWSERILLWLALSGGASLAQRISSDPEPPRVERT